MTAGIRGYKKEDRALCFSPPGDRIKPDNAVPGTALPARMSLFRGSSCKSCVYKRRRAVKKPNLDRGPQMDAKKEKKHTKERRFIADNVTLNRAGGVKN
jgi:hypothetical protein